MMKLTTVLEQGRKAILAGWFDSIIKSYPADASQFLAKQKDRFRNPVGYAISEGIKTVFDFVVGTDGKQEVLPAVDGIVRIRAVQDFKPSEAVAFVYQLKREIRDMLGDRAHMFERSGELPDLEARIDDLALLAFDNYMECRETLHQVRTGEIQRRSSRLLNRVNDRPGISQCKGETVHDDS